jgi:hypothetical protein
MDFLKTKMTNQAAGFSDNYTTDVGNVSLHRKDSEKSEVTQREWPSEDYPEINWKIPISYFNEQSS